MGLLGNGWDDPQSAAVMSLAGGLLQGNFGQGLLGANDAFRQAKQDAAKQQFMQMQMQEHQLALEKAKRDAANEQGLLGLQPQFFRPGSAGLGGTADVNAALPPELRIGAQTPVPAQAPQFDVKGYTSTALQKGYMNPLDAMKLQQAFAKETPINKLDVKDFTPASVQKFAQTGNYGDLVRLEKLHFGDTGGGIAAFDQYTGRPVSTTPKTGNQFSDLVLPDGNGGLRPNAPLIAAKKDIAKSGASNTSVKIENKLGEGIAAQVGPMLKESLIQANGAVDAIDAANRITAAADTGKLFAGPGSGFKMKTAQLADVIGVAGKDTAERIANTRQVIRGLAEMTLQGRKLMRGEGQITESEGALAERANSGNLEDLTVAEVKQLAAASKRAAQFIYTQHQQQLDNLAQHPGASGLAPFYKPRPIPSIVSAPKPAAAPSAAPRFLGFE